MKRVKIIFAIVLIAGASAWAYAAFNPEHEHATCYGKSPCNACKNCSGCAHCSKNGGTCGVCK